MSFVAESDGKVIGTIMASHDGRRGYFRKAGVSKSHVHVLGDNNIAREFWLARGWQLRDDIAVFSFVNDGDDNA